MKKILMLLVAVLAAVGFSARAYNCPENLYFYVSNATSSTPFSKSGSTFTYTVDATNGEVAGVIVNKNVSAWDGDNGAHKANAYFANGKYGDITVNSAETWSSVSEWSGANTWSNGCYKFAKGHKYVITLNYSNGTFTGNVALDDTPAIKKSYTVYFYTTEAISGNIYAHIWESESVYFDTWGTGTSANQFKLLEGKKVVDNGKDYDVYSLTFEWDKEPKGILVYNGVSTKYVDDSSFANNGIYKKDTKDPVTNVTIEDKKDSYTYKLKADFGAGSWQDIIDFTDEDGNGVFEATYPGGNNWGGEFGIQFFTNGQNEKWYTVTSDNTYTPSEGGTLYDLTLNGSKMNLSGLYGDVKFALTVNDNAEPATLTISGGVAPVWYYSIGNGEKNEFVTSTPELSVNKDDIVYLWKDNAKMCTTENSNKSVSGNIDATDLKVSNYGFKASANGKMTLTLSDNNTKVTVKFTEVKAIPTTLWLGYKAEGNMADWDKTAMDPSGSNDHKFTKTSVAVKANQKFYYRFSVEENDATLWNTKKEGIFAPNGDTDTTAKTDFESNQGTNAFYTEPTQDGHYDIEATYTATNKLTFKLTFVPAQTPVTKTLYLAYKNRDTDTEWKVVDAGSVVDGKYKFTLPMYNQKDVKWKFVTSKSADLAAANDELFAPSEDRIPHNIAVNANSGTANWYFTPNYDGTITISGWFTNDAKTQINLDYSYVYNNRPSAGNFTYSTDGGNTWIQVPNRVIVEGEYTQWSVTLTGSNDQSVRFKLDDTEYKLNELNELGSTDNHYFKDFKPSFNKTYVFKGSYTYQFLIRKFNDIKNEEGEVVKTYDYEVAARKVATDAAFNEYSFAGEEGHPDSYRMDEVDVNLGLGKAGTVFKAQMEFDPTTAKMVVTPGNETGKEAEIHWVKYEHPFWGAKTAASMEYWQSDISVSDALWSSDTYLHPGDPRIATWFSAEQIANMDKRVSIDKIKDKNFTPKPGSKTTYYRAYVTMKDVHGAEETPANGPKRAVVNTEFAGNYGSRVAFAATIPADYVGSIVSGVEDVAVDAVEVFEGEAEYYTISGIRVYGEPAPGLYIVRRGNKVTKEIIR